MTDEPTPDLRTLQTDVLRLSGVIDGQRAKIAAQIDDALRDLSEQQSVLLALPLAIQESLSQGRLLTADEIFLTYRSILVAALTIKLRALDTTADRQGDLVRQCTELLALAARAEDEDDTPEFPTDYEG